MAENQPKEDNVLLQVRISRPLREEFMRLVKQEDDNASRLVRQWIREYMRTKAQSDMFENQ